MWDLPRQLGDDRPGAKKTNAAGAAGGAAAESEIFLAELAFSNPMDLPKIVERNLNKLDDKFYVCARPPPPPQPIAVGPTPPLPSQPRDVLASSGVAVGGVLV